MLLIVATPLLADDDIPESISFNFHVRPILSENCYYCHGPDPNHRKAGLRLDTEEGYLDVVEPGSPTDSELIARIFEDEDEDLLMPPADSGRKLSAREKQILKRWVQQGANYEAHWAFRKPIKPAVPKVTNNEWPRNPIDKFILANLERKSVKPSPRAEPLILVRRLYLDLIGLPPTPEQSAAFKEAYIKDSDEAINKLVDDLLASPHYGERMSLPWLDAARYSDSNGFQQDGDRNQWLWRDWVVTALNDNMPFDQFTIEQLAGDLLPDPTQEQRIATAFNRNHMLNGEGGAIKEEQRNNYVFDRVDTTATTWLGLTMACAQCHDHKYDPTTQKDYYRFFAYFNTIDEGGGVDRKYGRSMSAKPVMEIPTEAQLKSLADIDNEIKPLTESLKKADDEITKEMRAWEEEARTKPAPKKMNRDIFNLLVKLPKERDKRAENRLKAWYLEHMAKEEWREIKKKQSQLSRKKNKVKSEILTVMVMREQKRPRKTFVLKRGDYLARGEKVNSGVPGFLPGLADAKNSNSENSNRLDLANWLVSPENPLTSRVQVNRYWQTFFGTGLVDTPEDFGVQGGLPSHPDLLDWLAVDFRENDWDVKRMHRMMVTSETYLQSSKTRTDLKDTDPANRLLARSPRFRLPSTLIRDSALAVSGLMNSEIGGAPVYPYQPGRLWEEFSLKKFRYTPSDGKDLYRRSLYTFWRRTVPPPNMFDSSNRQTCTVKLSRTNTPLQALTLLNDPTYVEAARHLAAKVISEAADADDADWLRLSFARAVGREPTKAELGSLVTAIDQSRKFFESNAEAGKKYLSTGTTGSAPEDENELTSLAALSSVVQIIMNTDEFMTRE